MASLNGVLPEDGAAPGVTRVRYGGGQWFLPVGSRLCLGRSRSCDVRLPDDDHLSRRAGSLHGLTDCVLVRNDSATKPLVLRPPIGEDRLVEPGAGTTSLPYRRFAVVLAGCGGSLVSVEVDVRPLAPPARPVASGSTRAGPTVTDPVDLSAAQRRVLTELCLPVLTSSGALAVPATYAAVGERLGLSPGYVRNVVKSLREMLAGCGVPGLTADDPDGARADYRWPLVRWALRSGWVTALDADVHTGVGYWHDRRSSRMG